MEDFYNIDNAKNTVPRGVAYGGTVSGSGNAGEEKLLTLTPAVAPAPQSWWDVLPNMSATSRWFVYLPDDDMIVKVENVNTDLVIRVDEDVSAIASSSFQLIFADLTSYSITNVGSADAVRNGVSFAAGSDDSVSNQEHRSPAWLDPVLIDATGTVVQVATQKG